MQWVSRAWEGVSTEIIERSFKACGISNSLNGGEDDMIHDKLVDAIAAGERNEDEVHEEALELLFNSDSDDDESFYGFPDEDEDEDEDEEAATDTDE